MTDRAAINGTSTAFKVVGEGHPLLLLHGGEASHTMFNGLAALLSKRFTVVLYDQRDCGETASPTATKVGLELLASDANELLLHLGFGGMAHVFGTSFGGRIAQALAIQNGEIVSKLALGSTWQVSASLASIAPEARARMTALREGLPSTAEELAAMFISAGHLERHPNDRALFKNVNAASDRSRRRAAAMSDIPDLDLRLIQCPTLLIAGDLDQIVPAPITFGLSQWISKTKHFVMPGVGHLTSLESPETLAGALTEFFL